MAKIVILGAGPTGLSAAYHLEKKGWHDYAIFEKEETTGGLCRSIQQDGFTFDFTGHLLHINDPYFRSFIETIAGIDAFNSIIRRSFIYSNGVYTKYPFQTNLYGLPESVILECIEGFVKRRKTSSAQPSFPQWARAHFGAGIAKHFFMPYQKKIFAYDLHKITASWTGRFVPSTSLAHIVKGAFTDVSDEGIGYNAQFFYPKQGGISFWVDKLAQSLQKKVHTQYVVQSIDVQNKIVLFSNGHREPYEQLISTLPLDTMLRMLKEPTTLHVAHAASKLVCNKVINFNLGIFRPQVSDKHWIYYPEKQYPFYRIGFSHNFAQSMAPKECSSLYGEIAYVRKSTDWITRITQQAITQTKQLLQITDQEIVTQKIMHIDHAYVIYDFWREKNLPLIHKQLHEHHLYSVGRYGEWKYASMQEAVLDGKKIADTLTTTALGHSYYVQPTKTSPSVTP